MTVSDSSIVATLGPSGTCSEYVFSLNQSRFGANPKLVLHKSYIDVVGSVLDGKCEYGLVAAAYPDLHQLIFSNYHTLCIVDCFVAETPALVVARNKCTKHKTIKISCFSAVEPLAQGLYPEAILINALSNADAADLVVYGAADHAITTLPAATSRNLEITYSFGCIAIPWVVFKKTNSI